MLPKAPFWWRRGRVRLTIPNRVYKRPEDRRYKGRTNVERVYGRLKDEFGGRMIRVRGYAKVMTHLMFGVLALSADQLMRLVTQPLT